MDSRKRKVVDLLKTRADTLHSQRLVSLVTEISASPFDKITKLIQELIERLLQEAADDANHQGWCTKELTEAKAQRNFEALIAQKAAETKHKNEEIEDRETLKAEADVQLADSMQELDDLQKQFKADIEFFDLTTAACRAKHEEWTTRSEERQAELKGIREALEILTSDDARKLFAKAVKPGVGSMFLQTSSDYVSDNAPAAKAYKVLKEQAKQAHSMRLASLAASVRLVANGHFDKVIKAINDMLATLKSEEGEDIQQRDWCKDEYHENAEEKAELKWLIVRNEAVIEKLDQKIDELTKNIEDTVKEITATKDQIKKMEDERVEEHDEFKHAKADDEDATKLLSQAIEALSKYYKNSKVEMDLLQQPKFEVSQWDAPDATFSDKGKRKNESKGIIQILTMLKEDLLDEIKNGVEDEVAAQAEFEKQVNSAKALIKDLEEKKVNLEFDKAAAVEKKTTKEEDMAANHKDVGINEDYKKKISPDCDWMINSFEERKKKRADEMTGLVKAKEFLAGSQ